MQAHRRAIGSPHPVLSSGISHSVRSPQHLTLRMRAHERFLRVGKTAVSQLPHS